MSKDLVVPGEARPISLLDVMLELALVRQDIAALHNELAVTFSTDEFDPRRREMSDILTEAVTKRLEAEEAVRKKYGYEP